MRLRNDATGYGLVTKSLHWLTVALLLAQFAVGYVMDAGGSGRGRGRGRSGESGRGRGRGGDDYDLGFGDDGNPLLTLHVLLGVSILVVATVRLVWRRLTPLPPWAPALSARERRLATWTERTLYLTLFAMPASGLSLLLAGDDLLAVHIASHLLFFGALATHVGLVLKHQLANRDGLLRRMT